MAFLNVRGKLTKKKISSKVSPENFVFNPFLFKIVAQFLNVSWRQIAILKRGCKKRRKSACKMMYFVRNTILEQKKWKYFPWKYKMEFQLDNLSRLIWQRCVIQFDLPSQTHDSHLRLLIFQHNFYYKTYFPFKEVVNAVTSLYSSCTLSLFIDGCETKERKASLFWKSTLNFVRSFYTFIFESFPSHKIQADILEQSLLNFFLSFQWICFVTKTSFD